MINTTQSHAPHLY